MSVSDIDYVLLRFNQRLNDSLRKVIVLGVLVVISGVEICLVPKNELSLT